MPPIQSPPFAKLEDSSISRQAGLVTPVTVMASGIKLYSLPISEPYTVDPDGYTARRTRIVEIQRALAQAGCYRGETTGQWGADTKRALSIFLLAANARLPIEQPDDVLLHLVKGHRHVVCDEKPSAEPMQADRPDARPRKAVPPGLMGIGGPSPAVGVSVMTPEASALPGERAAVVSSRRRTPEKNGDSVVRSNRPYGTRKPVPSHEHFLHPLGTF